MSVESGADLAADDQAAALRRLVDFYLHTAYAGDRLLDPHRDLIELGPPVPGCRPEPLADTATALRWFGAEHANLLASQRLAVAKGWYTPAWQLAWALDTFHYRQGYLRDRVDCWRAGLAAAEDLVDPEVGALAHRQLGYAEARAGSLADAEHHLKHSLTVAGNAGDTLNQICVHHCLAWARAQRHDFPAALVHATEVVRLAETLGNRKWQAHGLNSVGWYHALLARYDQARAACERALALAVRQQDRECMAYTLDSLGYIAQHTGRPVRALRYYQQALTVYRRHLGDSYNEADTVDRVGDVHAARGHRSAAHDAWRQAGDLYRAQHRRADVERVARKRASGRDERVHLDERARGHVGVHH
jgi:tetratricopeptide (TPR) repeat protein